MMDQLIDVKFDDELFELNPEPVEPTLQLQLAPGVEMPKKATPGASCYDLFANESVDADFGQTIRVKTGIRSRIPVGYEVQIRPRSSSRDKYHDIAWGTIDSDYRGEWMVQLTVTLRPYVAIEKGDKIAQWTLVKKDDHRIEIVNDIAVDETVRKDGGFGSTGS